MYGVWKAEIFAGRMAKPLSWVARLTGYSPRFGFRREFLWGIRDYSYGQDHHSRGVYFYWFLPPGVYDTYRHISWKHDERQYIRIDDRGCIHEITKEEADSWLKNYLA